MTPAARYAAAIDVLDLIVTGAPAEQVLTQWARSNRYAGSKDRAAVRDHVYDVLRQKRSASAWGHGSDGRALILGMLRKQGRNPAEVFGAGGYGPPALSAAELAQSPPELSGAAAVDLPDWIWPVWQSDLGDAAAAAARMLQNRAAVQLRVNLRRTSVTEVQALLAQQDIGTRPVEDVKTALEVYENPRKIANSDAFRNGLVELQDAASQIAMNRIAPYAGARILDYCAGGGGKSLALADLTDAEISAYDADPKRMSDIAPRAERAGVKIEVCQTIPTGTFDLVLCDAPCSGSGTWRRQPDAKWRLQEHDLAAFSSVQRSVLAAAAPLVATGGCLSYATCSVFRCENHDVVAHFLAENPGFKLHFSEQLLPNHNHDGFFLALMQRV